MHGFTIFHQIENKQFCEIYSIQEFKELLFDSALLSENFMVLLILH